MKYNFTSIIIKEKKWYVARCAELDVVSQGKTIEEAKKNLKEAIELYLEDYSQTRVRTFASTHTPFISAIEVQYG